MGENGRVESEKGVHIGVTCSGMAGGWRLIVQDNQATVCDLGLAVEEMEGLMGLIIQTARALDKRQRGHFLGVLIGAMHELEPAVSVSVKGEGQ